MYRQTYESGVIPYLDSRPYPYPFNATYNEWLLEPPRKYFDSLNYAKVLFRVQDSTSLSGYSYGLMSYMYFVNWPSWESLIFSFDPTTGACTRYNGTLAPIWLAWTREIVQDYYGTLWRSDIFGSINPLTVYLDGTNFTITEGESIPPSRYDRISISHPIVDTQNDLIAMGGDYQSMSVYTFSTGELLRKIPLSGDIVAVCAGDQDFAFVLCHNDTLDVVNIRTGKVVGVSKFERPDGVEGVPLLSWDYRYRRLLTFIHTPDAEDGSATARVRGYYPVPVPTALTNPVPIKPLRINRTVPVVTRMVGDVGEPLSGGVVVGSITPTPPAAASLASVTESPDKNGYISFRMTGTHQGDIEFGVTAEV
jgi:hypothetical protein